MPSSEQRDLRTLLRDRDQWVRMRTRLQHTLQAIALNHAPCDKAVHSGVRQGSAHWKPYLCHPTPVKDEVSCSVCTLNCRSGSRNWIKQWNNKPNEECRRAGC